MELGFNIGKQWLWYVILVVAICMGAIPLVLLKNEILTNNAINILIAGISMLYFAFIVGRIGITKKN